MSLPRVRLAALHRKLAGLDAERAALQLQIAELLEADAENDETTSPKAKRPRRLVVIPPPALPLAPAVEPSEVDRARARAALRRVGYRVKATP